MLAVPAAHRLEFDWGQDLARLGDRLADKYPGEHVWLLYKGRGAPAYYGIKADNPLTVPEGDVHGLVVVSSTCLRSAVCISAKTDTAANRRKLAEILNSSKQIDEVGHAILIYRR